MKTISDIQKLEIIVHIDEGDIEMMSEINNINSNYPNLVKYIETNLIESFSDAWKPLNLLLKETSKDIQIISCISDNLRFEKKNWDIILLSYSEKFDDNIYRLRCSKYKFQKYDDIWQCDEPDSYAFIQKNGLKPLVSGVHVLAQILIMSAFPFM